MLGIQKKKKWKAGRDAAEEGRTHKERIRNKERKVIYNNKRKVMNLRGLEKTGASASDLHTLLLFVCLHVSAIFS